MASVGIFLCKSCLKSGSTTSYYEELGLEKSHCDSEAVKRAYKKLSLTLHPDKIAQRGGVVTENDKAQLLRVKEAYAVLVDPKRRKMYDQLGETGLKLVEEPSAAMKPEMQAKIIQNFQKNSTDRYILFLGILLFYCCLAIFPILFAAKCDGYIPQVPWAALWTPLWAYDALLLLTAVLGFVLRHKVEDEEGNITVEPRTWADFGDDLINLSLTALWCLIQVFLVLRLDRVILWSWFSIFAPWFAYDAIKFLAHIHSGYFATVPRPSPAFSSVKRASQGGSAGDEEEGGAGEGEDEDAQFHAEMEYYQKVMLQQDEKQSVVLSALRVWLAAFLAYKLDAITNTDTSANGIGSFWNWGFVMLPVWVWILYCYIEAVRGYWRGSSLSASVAVEIEEAGGPEHLTPATMVKMQVAEGMTSQCYVSCCCIIPVPVLVSVLLVSSLETPTQISTFIIILPVFLALFLLLACLVTVWCCLVSVDADGVVAAANAANASQDAAGQPGYSDDAEGGKQASPAAVEGQGGLEGEGRSPVVNMAAAAAAVVVVVPMTIAEAEAGTGAGAGAGAGAGVLAVAAESEGVASVDLIDLTPGPAAGSEAGAGAGAGVVAGSSSPPPVNISVPLNADEID